MTMLHVSIDFLASFGLFNLVGCSFFLYWSFGCCELKYNKFDGVLHNPVCRLLLLVFDIFVSLNFDVYHYSLSVSLSLFLSLSFLCCLTAAEVVGFLTPYCSCSALLSHTHSSTMLRTTSHPPRTFCFCDCFVWILLNCFACLRDALLPFLHLSLRRLRCIPAALVREYHCGCCCAAFLSMGSFVRS